jgi:protoporphyrinogen oxidase
VSHKIKNLILGGGLAGISASFHIGHADCLILEARPHLFGLLATRKRNGFTWDNGPHVSFTKNEEVRRLFAESTGDRFHDIPVNVGNYFHGSWVRHPAQVNLAQIPEPLRSACVADFLNPPQITAPANYQQWLDASLGKTFADKFSAAYTRKYWTVPPAALSCDWVGGRVHRPKQEDVLAGAQSDIPRNLHYINRIRYPQTGGYQSFAAKLAEGINARLNTRITSIDLDSKQVRSENGEVFHYERLISTIPLPAFITACAQSTPAMREAAASLLCTSAHLVEVELPELTKRPEHWFYIYNENFFSTRINFTEKLSPDNAPVGRSGVQVEVYSNPKKPLSIPQEKLAGHVIAELAEMGIVHDASVPRLRAETTHIPFANVTFLTDTAARLEVIWAGLEKHGLAREPADTHPMTDWTAPTRSGLENAPLLMAGRFGQWKYFWTDDCVLRGRQLGQALAEKSSPA